VPRRRRPGPATHPGGGHTILVGRVERISTSIGEPLVHFDRRFCGLSLTPAL
jgi:flavin reductase (DIM6/NTAB) family NADH-FMN oxidoreductase RutF